MNSGLLPPSPRAPPRRVFTSPSPLRGGRGISVLWQNMCSWPPPPSPKTTWLKVAPTSQVPQPTFKSSSNLLQQLLPRPLSLSLLSSFHLSALLYSSSFHWSYNDDGGASLLLPPSDSSLPDLHLTSSSQTQSKKTRKSGTFHKKYTLNKFTLERAFKPSYTLSSIWAFIRIFEHLSLHTQFWEASMPSYTWN